MTLAYTVDQSIALQVGVHYLDLHNDYELVSAWHATTRGYLSFVKRNANWVKAPDPTHITLVFEQVTFWQQSESMPLPNSVEEIGFKEPDDPDLDWLEEHLGDEKKHILFRLEEDAFIRIGAGASLLLTVPFTS